MARARVKTRAYAILFIYAAWAICTWMIFVYGRLIYSLEGSKGEASFVQSWGIAVGLEQGNGFQELVNSAIKGAVIALLLEPFIVRAPHPRWPAACP